MTKFLLPFLLLPLCCVCDSQSVNCSTVMEAENLTQRFEGVVAHGIHSLSLEDIHYYFNPNVGEENNVPVVDSDLTSHTPVLSHAQRMNYNKFSSVGMNVADRVLTNMDKPMYDIKNFNALERIIHHLHMHEMWQRARDFYEVLKISPPSRDLCHCVTDIQHNGVMSNSRLNALKIREPEVFYKQGKEPGYEVSYSYQSKKDELKKTTNEADRESEKETEEESAKKKGDNENNKVEPGYEVSYSYHSKKDELKKTPNEVARASENEGNDKVGYNVEYVVGYCYGNCNKEGEVLGEQEEGMPSLTDEVAWGKWKNMALDTEEEDHYQLALFLFCTLEK